MRTSDEHGDKARTHRLAVEAWRTVVASEESLKFKVGDVVRLKSGGPKMTIESTFSAAKNVRVVWVQNNGTLSRDLFNESHLVAA